MEQGAGEIEAAGADAHRLRHADEGARGFPAIALPAANDVGGAGAEGRPRILLARLYFAVKNVRADIVSQGEGLLARGRGVRAADDVVRDSADIAGILRLSKDLPQSGKEHCRHEEKGDMAAQKRYDGHGLFG